MDLARWELEQEGIGGSSVLWREGIREGCARSSGDFGVRRRRARAGFQQQVGFGGSRRRARGGRQRLRRGGMEAGHGGTARSLRGSGSSGATEGAPGVPGGALEEPRPTHRSFLAVCLLGWAEMQEY
jgi:hypothetical protein